MENAPLALSGRIRPEDPRRIRAFREKTAGLDWAPSQAEQSLNTLFAAVDDLAEAEVLYYFRRRVTRAWISGITRFGAWLFGTVGLLLPLLPGGPGEFFEGWQHYGYVSLVTSASFLAANSLFGGTEGHIRFVSTQLELEKLITASRVGWCKYRSGQHETDAPLTEGFGIILAYATSLHAATIGETGRWGQTLLSELAAYQKSIKTNQSPS
ncbi:hypothetical protein SAMN02745857_03114 [Andreprevotia lacus DSM 23236]|uniref:SMODS and SLOG-associating 2TM effector domain-containing protein n=1 Tax=Andreprevotia lacus DSM 23236 TaxID=1121001 RepID=A0A1W1XX30_9NEIS|nr:SLATT domain-containing protein [Andreprevotia lacus]SMC28091.1 hypothetical protein SAMN02745857_03114 [Andreprevotia lacus DSM 23236]